VVISAIYGLRAAAKIFFGPPSEAFAAVAAANPPADLRWAEKIPALLLLGALLFIGYWPKAISTPLNAAVTALYPAPAPAPPAPAAQP
jgi:NADH-quinone oxidoreductase subunit M